jgi:hypothetical protein
MPVHKQTKNYFDIIRENIENGYEYPEAIVVSANPALRQKSNYYEVYHFDGEDFIYLYTYWGPDINLLDLSSYNYKEWARNARPEYVEKIKRLPRYTLQHFISKALWNGRPYKETPLCK